MDPTEYEFNATGFVYKRQIGNLEPPILSEFECMAHTKVCVRVFISWKTQNGCVYPQNTVKWLFSTLPIETLCSRLFAAPVSTWCRFMWLLFFFAFCYCCFFIELLKMLDICQKVFVPLFFFLLQNRRDKAKIFVCLQKLQVGFHFLNNLLLSLLMLLFQSLMLLLLTLLINLESNN